MRGTVSVRNFLGSGLNLTLSLKDRVPLCDCTLLESKSLPGGVRSALQGFLGSSTRAVLFTWQQTRSSPPHHLWTPNISEAASGAHILMTTGAYRTGGATANGKAL